MRMFRLSALAYLACGSTVALAQVAEDVVGAVADDSDSFAYLVQSLGGGQGAATLGAAGIGVQVLTKALERPLADTWFGDGLGKIVLVGGLTFLAAPVSLVALGGLSIGAALTHAATLTAFQVFGNQVVKQIKNEKEKPK